MKVLNSWLHELLDAPVAPEAVAAAFDDLGTPVEEEVRLGEGLDGIVVAQVLALSVHPNADKIQLVDVDRGDGEPLQICCGAFNMAVGDKVPLATLGTTMPGGMKIERRKLRGEWSNGMLCSSRELGLGDEHAGIKVLPPELVAGTPITEALGIEPDVRWELEVNPNRPDAMSVAGLARDVAAKVGVGFHLPAPPSAAASIGEPVTWASSGPGGRSTAALPGGGELTIDVAAPDGCGRFVGRVLRGVDATAPSPEWLQHRLTELGMRPISALVDISNYVMLELGQPNHPYDLAKVAGATLRARRAKDGETLVTLDDVERTFTADDLLITDGDDVAVGIAGIMGGAACEISDATTDVLLEMAWFDPTSVSRSSRRLGLRSEASARFEKGVDPAIADLAADRFCQLAAEICGATTEPVQVDVRGTLPERPPVPVRTARVNALLGTDLSSERIAELLAPIGFATSLLEADVQVVTIPTWRYDSATEIDVVEEVGRHHGYRNIPNRELTEARAGRLTDLQKERRGVRRLFCGLGLAECQPLPFLAPGQLAAAGLDPGGIELVNPLVAEESVLRTALLPGLVAAVAHNHARRQLAVGLWEIGHVFLPAPDGQVLPDEREHAAVVLAGRDATAAVEAWQVLAEQLRLESPSVENAEVPGLHPTRSGRVLVDGVPFGIVGEIDPAVLARHSIGERVAYLEVDLGALFGAPRRSPAYRQISRFPSSDIDLAFEVPEAVSAVAVERTLAATDPLVWSVKLFDAYRGAPVAPDHRSLAFGLRLQAVDRTLTDAEVAEVRTRLIAAVEQAHQATLRG
ncbi:phenylalanine--tRNA ligase subunit beta [Aquihabitans sp. G128]|uniref:phenylalanine--tRNA ligase subunit beta n=1 Tax=Aquihabitans sp. G128 TaxID=2849779 RepID=UPI001C228F5D|nr:phenylalanine--tRNA ligase subunit beta [Aquihabitans sp. G128]QXC61906.1 phenylalanine--tRNA ligase subunit beta [Aquihabitans sp. G128]